ncbi:hypothetical protein EIN_135230 [Entamoeba invadens IP1]|uniref:Uncharacterized protein n=1 Tax=Entamoeba invadens IP1 TaxID=370355 RepID=A0A0A1U307_ENTIV|nr:hypothetical protein EIN_135230 [Entamoeba invadens IP1]ELP85939.1 hypothetical protein EIN_135230 [Entamoeba invadens IP1]|eukprot:XP_004185285.1 hypothetical protein EIN_135230 [Entamoeba invadens IP1]
MKPVNCSIFLMGKIGVGKSTFALRFCHQVFVKINEPSDLNNYKRVIKLTESDGEQRDVVVELIDQYNPSDVPQILESYMNNTDGYFVFVSSTNPNSIKEVDVIQEILKRYSSNHNNKALPIILVETKCEDINNYCVSQHEVIKCAKKLHSDVVRVSSLTGFNVYTAIKTMSSIVVRTKPNPVSETTVGEAFQLSHNSKQCVVV